jgi:uncharacterized protein DUF992
MSCHFVPNGPYPPQNYSGVMNTVGLELGVTAGGVMAWGVFAPAGGTPIGALAGEYIGASGDISAGVGVGANVLFGGSNDCFAAAVSRGRRGRGGFPGRFGLYAGSGALTS